MLLTPEQIEEIEKTKRAPEGYRWVCCACGKTAQYKYGEGRTSRGWDVSCVLNCVLVEEKDLEYDEHGRVQNINAIAYDPASFRGILGGDEPVEEEHDGSG